MRNVSAEFKEAMYAAQTGDGFIILLTLRHDDLDPPIRVCDNNKNVTSRGNEFITYPFEISFPDISDERPPQAQLKIDNVHRDIIQNLRLIRTPIFVDVEVVRIKDNHTVEVEFLDFIMRNITYDELTITGALVLESLLVEPYPADTYVPSKFPGLFLALLAISHLLVL
jgi:hypothetical protein